MLKIVFVDDEPLTLKMLRKLLDWNRLDIEVAGEASNGLDALVLVEEVKPDIVLVDIKMPFMDGLRFMEELKKRKSNAAIIVLSAYSEFSYAQKAISSGAFDYLLKPVDENKLLEIIFEIKSKIIEESRKLIEYEANKKKAAEVIMLQHSKTLTEAINSRISDEANTEKLRNIAINLSLDCYRVLLIWLEEKAEDFHSLINKGIATDAVSIVETAMINHDLSGIVFTKVAGEIVCIVKMAEGIPNNIAEEAVRKLSADMTTQINIFKRKNIHIGISNLTKGILNLKKAYNEALIASENIFYEGTNQAFLYDETSLTNINYSAMGADMEKNLLESFELGLTNRIEEQFDALRAKFYLTRPFPKNVYEICFEILLSVKKRVSLSSTQSYAGTAIMDLNPDMLKNNPTLDSLIDWAKGIISEASACMQATRNNPGKHSIEKVKDYLKQNYASQVTLEEVSEHVSVSKNYLCKLFKQEESKSIWDHLTIVRMEKAKELLKSTDMKSYEIASMIGYDSMYYFSKIFKRSVGISPLEYRNNRQI